MLERLASWLLAFILDYLYKKAKVAVEELVEEQKLAAERGAVNEENVRRYEEALDRKERIDAALELLNRN